MSRSVIDYLETTFNNLHSDASNEEAIRACVSADAIISPIIEKYKSEGKNLSSKEDKTPIPTGAEIRELMMRPIIPDYDQQNPYIEEQTSEQSDVEPKSHDEGIYR